MREARPSRAGGWTSVSCSDRPGGRRRQVRRRPPARLRRSGVASGGEAATAATRSAGCRGIRSRAASRIPYKDPRRRSAACRRPCRATEGSPTRLRPVFSSRRNAIFPMFSSNQSPIPCAISGDVSTTPISVLWITARGSRFREPMKTCLRSNTNDLACRLALDDPPVPFFSSRCSRVSFLFISYSSTPPRRSGLRYLAYPACTTLTSFEASELVRIRTRTPRAARPVRKAVPASPGTK